MTQITAVNAQNRADSVARHIIDLAALVGSPSAIIAGQATTLAGIAALNDEAQLNFLLTPFEQAKVAENAWLAMVQSYNAILDIWFTACAGLDMATGGLATFLQANSKQVDPHFLDAFNRAQLRGTLNPQLPLGAFLAFGNAVANMGQMNVTGSGAGNFVAGTAVNAAYGNAPLSLFNAGGGNTGAASGTYTVTYNAYNASGVLQVGLTVTGTVPNGTIPGAAVALGVSGVAVTNITLTGGTNGDQVAVKSTLLRTVTY